MTTDPTQISGKCTVRQPIPLHTLHGNEKQLAEYANRLITELEETESKLAPSSGL